MTPQAKRPPALPVVFESSCPPLPKSSASACTTTVRPKMLKFPASDKCLSSMSTLATPFSSAMMLPKSPACLTASVGAPWSLPAGLKCGPAAIGFSLVYNWLHFHHNHSYLTCSRLYCRQIREHGIRGAQLSVQKPPQSPSRAHHHSTNDNNRQSTIRIECRRITRWRSRVFWKYLELFFINDAILRFAGRRLFLWHHRPRHKLLSASLIDSFSLNWNVLDREFTIQFAGAGFDCFAHGTAENKKKVGL